MSRKIFLKRSQTQTVPEVEAREVIQVDEAFVDKVTELTALGSAVLEQKFDRVLMTREQMLSENDGIGLIGSQGYTTACDERRACGEEIQEIPSNDEQKHELLEHLELSCELVMELESSPSPLNKQVRIDRKRRNATSESNVSDPKTLHTIDVQQCNQRNNTTKSDAAVVLDNHQMGDVVPHLRTAHRDDKSKQTQVALRLKKRQVHLTRKSSEVSLRHAPHGREKQSKTHSCTECGKAFTWKSQLITHLRTHTGEKPFKCTDCGVAFSQRNSLFRHQMTHTGEKPLECQICSVAFRQKSTLDRHLLIHAKKKPFECSICNRSFRHKVSLSEHMDTHSGRKPYQCNVCKDTFRQRSVLSKHRRVHAPDEE